MAIDGESFKDVFFTLPGIGRVEVTLKVRDIVYLKHLERIIMKLEKIAQKR